jgi:hypothetical protein
VANLGLAIERPAPAEPVPELPDSAARKFLIGERRRQRVVVLVGNARDQRSQGGQARGQR